jgi:hypothetical protein
MSIDVKEEILIARPREKVASVMFDPHFDCVWISGLKKSFPMATGLLQKDARVEWVGEYFGRAFSTFAITSKAEENKNVVINVDEPFEMSIEYTLADAPEGTLAKIRVKSFGENLIKMPPAVLSRKMADKLRDDLKALKKKVEFD